MKKITFNSNYDTKLVIINDNNEVKRVISIELCSIQIYLFIVKLNINEKKYVENATNAIRQILIVKRLN